ncbi:MAG: Rrf2 family transcriptional regulator [Candidatus Marinimicrobia bacterium]|nr:Rrf2 family transcriptional regulator [Candidatus Neomarinimicrobiota bacterium]
MLKLTRKTEYALIALSHMQRFTPKNLISTKELAKLYQLPVELLAKTLQQLAQAEILEAVKGAYGGYKIKTPLEQINMTEFFEVLEGEVGLTDCHTNTDCSQKNLCNIKTPMQKINKKMRTFFDEISLKEVVGN